MIQLFNFILLIIIIIKIWGIKVPSKHKVKGKKLIIDTCALIDGRILELASAGFVSQELIIPEFVTHELQILADGSDPHKRERARYGLDVVKDLQNSKNCIVTMDHTTIEGRLPTDDKLVVLSKKFNAPLYTTDYNLQKIAEIEGVNVLNVNDLAQKLRPVALPGENKTIKILQKGQSSQQGVGYLEDGTMVVVEHAAKIIGKVVEVEITRTHQTVAGKMLFAEIKKIPITSQNIHEYSGRLKKRKQITS
ncbi:MAG: hypothetical protein NVSMB46_06870 [Candidatus Saccharimonadales bacterium]